MQALSVQPSTHLLLETFPSIIRQKFSNVFVTGSSNLEMLDLLLYLRPGCAEDGVTTVVEEFHHLLDDFGIALVKIGDSSPCLLVHINSGSRY